MTGRARFRAAALTAAGIVVVLAMGAPLVAFVVVLVAAVVGMVAAIAPEGASRAMGACARLSRHGRIGIERDRERIAGTELQSDEYDCAAENAGRVQ
jgi:hypothetical protein